MANALLDGWFKLDLGEGAFYAVFGFMFVFLGIAVLILIFSLLGKIMAAVNKKNAKKTEPTHVSVGETIPVTESGVSPELVAVITAAIAAYYEGETVKCDFVVRRIKKL